MFTKLISVYGEVEYEEPLNFFEHPRSDVEKEHFTHL